MSKDIDSLFDIIEGRRKAEREGGREGGGAQDRQGSRERGSTALFYHIRKRENATSENVLHHSNPSLGTIHCTVAQ